MHDLRSEMLAYSLDPVSGASSSVHVSVLRRETQSSCSIDPPDDFAANK